MTPALEIRLAQPHEAVLVYDRFEIDLAWVPTNIAP